MAAARDGSLQLGFGLGKYTNRNVMDCYAGISRGTEQITVRGSRRLSDDQELLGAGPIRYEVLEPLKTVRFSLEANDTQPIAFEWIYETVLPPLVEDRTHNRTAGRIAAELVRYHQIGVCSGWVEIDGERTEITPDTWVSTRDHSWGVRYDVGAPADRPRAGRRPRRPAVPVRLEPGADGAPRRQPLRPVPERRPRVGPGLPAAHDHRPGRARRRHASSTSTTSSSTSPTTR